MTPEAQRIAIAEACGVKLFVLHKPIHDPFGYYRENAHGYTSNLSEAWKVPQDAAKKYICGRDSDPDRVIAEPAPIPNYTADLNAMNEAEKILTDEQYALFRKHLCDLHGSGFRVYSATAPHRAEAFLRTIGKWEDK